MRAGEFDFWVPPCLILGRCLFLHFPPPHPPPLVSCRCQQSAYEGQEPRDKAANKEDKTKEDPDNPPEGEGKGKEETPRPQCTDLLDFRWLQEKEEEEGSLQEQPSITTEDNISQGPPDINSPGDNKEHLEPSVEKVLPSDTTKSHQPESAATDHEAYYLADDEETLLSDSCASTGYFPCYRTYEEFPRYQPPGRPEDRESGAPRPVRKRIPPTKGPHHSPPSPLPAASVSRKCPQKRKNRGAPEKEQAAEGGPKPRLQEQRSLPPNPEAEGKQVSLETERGKRSPQQGPSAGSRTSAKETHDTPPEPRTTPSRLSLRSLVCWVRKIFRKAPSPQPPPQPSTSSGAQVGRPLARRLGRWIAQYRSRIHPQSM
ncbi:serine/arginine repetitive matrix protein 1-like [Lacerta agilis]|uniref:serine/arginine repetitive matrix protein 1-like n=1 Tax=Lacerta agilis TaxID=80427 RepID=UPI00141927FC|nr:serine/arginine repetitive matrix protein 1-like [Lacerta agilis]